MKKQLLLTTFLCLLSVVCQAQKKYEMVIEKTDGTNIVVNTEDIVRTYFRERTGGETPQHAAIDIVGTWYVYESDVAGLDGIWTFNADGIGTIEEFYHGESEGVDKMTYELTGTRLLIYLEGEEDDPLEFDINVVSNDEFTWTDGHDTLTFKRHDSGNENPSDIADFNIVGKWHQYADNRQEASAEWMFYADGTGYCVPLPIYPGEGQDPFTYSIDNTTLTIRWEDGTSVYEIHIVSATEYWYDNDSSWAKKLTFKKVDDGDNKPQAFLSCPDDHHPHMIDLGLPSGTKWACCNVDTDHPENQSPTNYGGYYAWGETEIKATYDWSTYIHCDGSESTIHDLGGDIAGTQYDVAHVKWGGSWVMPSQDQVKELINNCTYEWTSENGVQCGKFTSKINGFCVFMPAAGSRSGDGLRNISRGYYWSSYQAETYYYTCDLYFRSDDVGWVIDYYRETGRTVRPVSK